MITPPLFLYVTCVSFILVMPRFNMQSELYFGTVEKEDKGQKMAEAIMHFKEEGGV